MRKSIRLDSAFTAQIEAWRTARGTDAGLRHMIVVAGPYGAGKSTLARRIVEGRLPAELSAHVPRRAAGWAQTSGRKVFSPGDGRASAAEAPGLILHYNILRPPIHDFSSYADDPVLEAIDVAARATILTIRPDLPQLIGQFVDRSLVEQAHSSWAARLRRGLLSRLPDGRWVGEAAVVPEPPNARRLVGRYRRVYRLYQKPGWLDGRYGAWRDFLAAESAAGRDMAVIWLEPVVDDAGEPSFRIIGTSGDASN